MSEIEVAASVEAFVRTHFSVSPTDKGFSTTIDLFDGGYVDSVGIVELLEFVQDTFAVAIPEADLFSDDFSSIEGIAGIVADLRQHSPAPETGP